MTFPSKIFIDGGDPEETRQADAILKKAGHKGLEGQTTNPTLIAKRFIARDKGQAGDKGMRITETEALTFYKKTVQDMAKVTKGPISIQVLGGADMTVEDMLAQARDRITWIPNAVIKFPCTMNGLKAAEIFCQEGPINITLAFSQEQAAAVYGATLRRGFSPQGKPYDVFVSPFVGRLDDRGEKGMDVVTNIVEMYRKLGDGHVKVLTASARTVDHVLFALWLKSDVITLPLSVLKEWAQPTEGSGRAPFQAPSADYFYDAPGLTEIPYRELTLDKEWTEYDIRHDLTDQGVKKFWEDWKAIVE
jgi:transaldolase